MKTLKTIAWAVAFIALFSACQSASDPKKILSDPVTRKAIIDTIANNREMMTEMMEAIMNSTTGKMMVMENEKMTMMMMMDNHGGMMQMMKKDPGMMQRMMSDMMETAKGDTAMMAGMCKTMMANQPMMNMMQKMKGMDMKAHH